MNKELLERLKKISERLKKEYKAEKVILYGSYARGEEKKHSDLDLLIIAPTKERRFERIVKVLEIVDDLITDIPISPIVYTPSEIEQRKDNDAFIKTILKEGKEL